MSSENINIFPKYNYYNTFIEGGSYYGKGIENALEAGFKNIISIEITPCYYELCKYKFKDYDNVTIILGDTVKVLPDILKYINEPCVFWLDAHYTDPTTAYGDKMCPLLDELDIIKNHHINTHTLLVDDLRCWSESDWNYHNYNFNFDDILNKVLNINPNYDISFDTGFLPNDVLVAQYFEPEKNIVKLKELLHSAAV